MQRQMYGALCAKPNSLSRAEEVVAASHFERLGSAEPQKAHSTYVEELREADASKPTPFEDPFTYMVMVYLARKIEGAIAKIGWPLDAFPTFGTLPLNKLNARVTRVQESDEFLIGFQHGVFVFANHLTKAVAASFVKDGSPPSVFVKDGSPPDEYSRFSYGLAEIERCWDDDDEPVRRFRALLSSYLLDGNPFAGQYFLDDPSYAALAAIFRDSFQLFLFGHEVGHIVADHLPRGQCETLTLCSLEYEQLNPNWQMELEADTIGCQLAIRAMLDSGYDVALGYFGIDLFFTAQEIVDRALGVLSHGRPGQLRESISHPPNAIRKRQLREGLSGVVDPQTAISFRRLARAGEELLNALWARVEMHFLTLHEKGGRAARLWIA
jgi:hypothetical protein